MHRALIVSITSVSVSSNLAKDNDFAYELDGALERSVGRASQDVGQNAALRVFVREFRKAISGYEAVVDIELTSTETGRIVYIGTSRKYGSNRSALIEMIVYDVRRLVGVSGSLPVPVGGDKKPVVRPAKRPVVADLPSEVGSETILVADPLLNGTFTPDSDARDVEKILSEPPVIDTSKPLLAKEAPTPMAAPAKADAPVKAAKPAIEPSKVKPETKPASSAPVEADTSSADEPCVVTVNNDCTDPDE